MLARCALTFSKNQGADAFTSPLWVDEQRANASRINSRIEQIIVAIAPGIAPE